MCLDDNSLRLYPSQLGLAEPHSLHNAFFANHRVLSPSPPLALPKPFSRLELLTALACVYSFVVITVFPF
jgi:hypothetical protein